MTSRLVWQPGSVCTEGYSAGVSQHLCHEWQSVKLVLIAFELVSFLRIE